MFGFLLIFGGGRQRGARLTPESEKALKTFIKVYVLTIWGRTNTEKALKTWLDVQMLRERVFRKKFLFSQLVQILPYGAQRTSVSGSAVITKDEPIAPVWHFGEEDIRVLMRA